MDAAPLLGGSSGPPAGRVALERSASDSGAGRYAHEAASGLSVTLVGPRRARALANFLADPFHTAVNTPHARFCAAFAALYLSELLAFALLYFAWAELDGKPAAAGAETHCLPGVKAFPHALWFSVQTAMTIGYGGFGLTPNPSCTGLNALVTVQAVTSLLVDYTMLGLVFARLSRPYARARTLLFSHAVTLSAAPDGAPRLCWRVANARKHAVLAAKARLFALLPGDGAPRSAPMFRELEVQCDGAWDLGLPCTLCHDVTPASALRPWVRELRAGGSAVRLVAIVDAVDESTSTQFRAKHVYEGADVLPGHCFAPAFLADGETGLKVDLRTFDRTLPAQTADGTALPPLPPGRVPARETGLEAWRERALAAEAKLAAVVGAMAGG